MLKEYDYFIVTFIVILKSVLLVTFNFMLPMWLRIAIVAICLMVSLAFLGLFYTEIFGKSEEEESWKKWMHLVVGIIMPLLAYSFWEVSYMSPY